MAVFVPTRAEVEKLGGELGARWPRLSSAFYHGGEPIRVIRPFLEGQVERPFLLAMTAAGQSALNLPGLDTVVIYDARYGNVVDRGRNVLHRMYLGANEILQMAGRVHGRVAKGEVTILSRPRTRLRVAPAGPAGVPARRGRGARGADLRRNRGGRQRPRTAGAARPDGPTGDALRVLTRTPPGGRRPADPVRPRRWMRCPVERPWGEMLVHAEAELVPLAAVCREHRVAAPDDPGGARSARRPRHRQRSPHGVQSLRRGGEPAWRTSGEVYGLPRHLFEEGVDRVVRSGGACCSRPSRTPRSAWRRSTARWKLPLPRTLPYAGKELRHRWADLVARIMPFDLVIDEQTADGRPARVSKSSVAGSWGAVAGNAPLLRRPVRHPPRVDRGDDAELRPGAAARDLGGAGGAAVGRREAAGARGAPPAPLRRVRTGDGRRADWRGRSRLDLRAAARDALVAGLMEGRPASRPGWGSPGRSGKLREWWRRSGGTVEAASEGDSAAASDDPTRRGGRAGTASWPRGWRSTRRGWCRPTCGTRSEALPAMVRVRGDAVTIAYEMETGTGDRPDLAPRGPGVPMNEDELPVLDRPLRFGVAARGGPIRADTLRALQQLLREELAAAPRPERSPRPRAPWRPRRAPPRAPAPPLGCQPRGGRPRPDRLHHPLCEACHAPDTRSAGSAASCCSAFPASSSPCSCS